MASCAFCALPDDVREATLAKWRQDGIGAARLSVWLNEQHGFAISTAAIERCLYRNRHHTKDDEVKRADQLGKIAELLRRSDIDPDNIGKVQSIRLSEWQGLTKEAEGEAKVHNLSGASIVLSPSWEEGPRWTPVDRGKPVTIKVAGRPKLVADDGFKRAVVLPDVQIGFWRGGDGSLTPFHDLDAISLALEIVKEVRPDVIVLLGDYLDFAPLSDKFTREAGFALTIQPALDYGVELLSTLRALCPDAEIALIEGNHDRRLQKMITNNALDAFGIRKGGSAPDSWPVFSVPYLLRLDELAVTYVGGYPAGEYWLNDNLVCIHGFKVRGGNQSTAAAVIDDERVSIIFGHVHRIEKKHKTRRIRGGAKQAQAVSLGCLCRIDGTVPSSKGSTDVFGRPVPNVEDWQQAVGVVTFQPGDGGFAIEDIPLYPGRTTLFRGVPIGGAA
jgi:predicted phosphodiesterase